MTSKARQLADLGGDTANLEDISSVLSSGPLSNRNLIINGAMQVAQRGTSTTSLTNGTYLLDRFYTEVDGTWSGTLSQESSIVPEGFSYALKVAPSATTTPSGTNGISIAQKIEGYNIAQASFGTSNAKSLTLSFKVRSSKTGTYSFTLCNASASRSFVGEYTISSADTWESKSITISGDTSGSWPSNTNGSGFQLFMFLGNTSSAFTTSTTGSWLAGNYTRGSTNQVNLFDSATATFYLTGVQLEAGSVATPFEHRSYGEEVLRCARYFWRQQNSRFLCGYKRHDTQAFFDVKSPATMRATPTLSFPTGDYGTFTNIQTNFGTTQTTPYVVDFNADSGRYLVEVSTTWGSTHTLVPCWESFTMDHDAEL